MTPGKQWHWVLLSSGMWWQWVSLLNVPWDTIALCVITYCPLGYHVIESYCPLGYNGIECYHLMSPGIQWHWALSLTVPWDTMALCVNIYCPWDTLTLSVNIYYPKGCEGSVLTLSVLRDVKSCTLVDYYQTTLDNIPEHHNFQNLISFTSFEST